MPRFSTGEKRFQCTICGLKMHTSGELKQHTWIHTGTFCIVFHNMLKSHLKINK